MLALHNECLTRCYLLHRINLLEGPVGFSLGAPGAFKRLRELGLSRLRVKLQGLVLFGESLELLLHLAYSGFLLFPLTALLGRFVFSFGQRLLQGRHLGRGPWQIHGDPIILQPNFFSKA